MTCEACSEDERQCEATFTCEECGREKNVCRERVGESSTCVKCWELWTLGPEWVEGWNDEGRAHGTHSKKVRQIVRAAQVYQGMKEET